MKHVETKTVEEIGKLVREERKRQNVTQLHLAGLAGTGIRFVSDLENGKGTVQVQKLLKVVQTLGLGLFIFSPWEND
jgi:y4mF family transcriptional regulator